MLALAQDDNTTPTEATPTGTTPTDTTPPVDQESTNDSMPQDAIMPPANDSASGNGTDGSAAGGGDNATTGEDNATGADNMTTGEDNATGADANATDQQPAGPETGNITGRVYGTGHAPLGNATVFLDYDTPTLTDAGGAFRFVDVQPGEHAVQAQAPAGSEYRTRDVTVEVAAGENATADVELEEGGALLVHVLEPDGSPAAGAFVEAANEAAADDGQADYTDEHGDLKLSGVQAGAFTLTVTPPGDAHAAVATQRGVPVAHGVKEITVRLEPATALTVSVVDAAGAPIPDAWVDVASDDGYSNGDRADDAGVYHAEVPAGHYTIHARSPSTRYADADGEADVAHGAANVTLALPTAAFVTGHVRSDAGPLAGLTVFACQEDGGAYEEATTDASGAFRIEDLPAGSYHVHAYAPGAYADADVTSVIVPQNGTDVGDMLVVLPGSIAGRVTEPSGAPVPGATVWTVDSDGETWWGYSNATGEFAIEDLKAGSYELHVDAPGDSRWIDITPRTGIAVTAANVTSVGDVPLSRGLAITGVVVIAGAPVAGADVEVWSEGSDGQATTDQNGAFAIDGLQEGTFAAYVTAPGDQPNLWISPEDANAIVLGAGGVNVTLALPVPGHLVGHALDESNAPIVGAQIWAWGSAGYDSATTDASGAYSLTLPAGSYTLSAMHGQAQVVQSDIIVPRSNETTVTLTLSSGHAVTGHVRAGQAPARDAYVLAIATRNGTVVYSASIAVDAHGAYTLQDVPNGPLDVVATRWADARHESERSSTVTVTIDRADAQAPDLDFGGA